ncbi:MAG: DEAD/DEAH box helicase [Gammaproteobacteria bacterium]|jgi:ATP-dependent RNA helicase DeaD|nr:DEAD/DEAH box helicase [Gammaproteobacteria bacterium]MBT7603313.1 DEAD/DEAH box helicase [Gammaproteobacteria bacterium]
MENFEILGLNDVLNKSLKKMGFISPTPIQSKAIPIILSGKDILGSASTGTGKTGAFAIPVIEKILNSKEDCALIVTPTRELAKQVIDVFRTLLGNSNPVKACCLIGGEAIGKQLNQLKRKPRIIIGTPGRINDHLGKKSLSLKNSNYLVLDETDRMLDMGFGIQIDQILKFMPKKRQTLMFSATFPKNIVTLANKYLIEPEKITIDIENSILKNIKHEIIHIDNTNKYKTLLKQLEIRDGSVLVFAKTKHSTEKIAKNLIKDGIKANALNGDLRQSKRDKVMRGFRENKFKVLVATDIASRGLDVPHIKHVINYDLPQVAEDYIHRIGRTARAGANGEAICFVSPNEGHLWLNIDMLINPDAKNRMSSRRGASDKRNGRRKVKSKFKTSENSEKKYKGKSKFKTSENSGKKYKGKSKFKKSENGETKYKGKKRSASKNTIRSSDAKPKKRFYPAKKKKVR